NDLRAIRERMDDNSVRLGQVTQEVDALRQTVVRIGAGGGGGAVPATPESSAVPNSTSTPPGAFIAGGLSPTAAFTQAEGDYFSGNYDVAIVSLEQFIKDFPNSEQA